MNTSLSHNQGSTAATVAGGLAAIITFAYGIAMVVVGLSSDPDDSPGWTLAVVGGASILLAFLFASLAWLAATSRGGAASAVTAMLGGAAMVASVLMAPIVGSAAYVVTGVIAVVTVVGMATSARGGR